MIFLKKLKTLDAEFLMFCKEMKLENPVPFYQTSSWFYLKDSELTKSYTFKMLMEEET